MIAFEDPSSSCQASAQHGFVGPGNNNLSSGLTHNRDNLLLEACPREIRSRFVLAVFIVIHLQGIDGTSGWLPGQFRELLLPDVDDLAISPGNNAVVSLELGLVALLEDLVLEILRKDTQYHVAQQPRAMSQLLPVCCQDIHPVIQMF